jgi:hypothetical protein
VCNDERIVGSAFVDRLAPVVESRAILDGLGIKAPLARSRRALLAAVCCDSASVSHVLFDGIVTCVVVELVLGGGVFVLRRQTHRDVGFSIIAWTVDPGSDVF